MRTEIIVCEGSSEKAYVQALNRILYRGSDAWPLPAFRPELAGQGCYSSVVKTFKAVVVSSAMTFFQGKRNETFPERFTIVS